MRKMMLAVAILAALPSFAYGQNEFDGTWSTTGSGDPSLIKLDPTDKRVGAAPAGG
jgi:hypothetical protein